MSYKEKIINKLKKGYSPIEGSPKEELKSTFKKIFKPIVDRRDLNFFFELFDSNDVILRAWGFLGLYHIIKESHVDQEEKILKIQKIILDILNDKREIVYYGGSSEIQSSLREHHIRRICELDNSLVFEPVFKYIKTFENGIDNVIAELLENVLAKYPDSSIESLILEYSKTINKDDFYIKAHIINAFENLGQIIELKQKDTITKLFRIYLNEIKEDTSNYQEITNKKWELQKSIFKVGAILGLALEEETIKFVESLEYPFDSLDQIAKTYKSNEKFKSILLKKLKETKNPRLISDILKSILVLKEIIENWKELIIEYVKKYQIIDGNLITEMQESNLINEEMIITFLNEGGKWNLDFIREFFINNPELLDEWQKSKNEFIRFLEIFEKSEHNLNKIKEIKEMILKLIIDLKREDLTPYCFENFKNLEEEALKKLALFPILKFGKEDLLLQLKEYMKNNVESAKFVIRFWGRLERNDWRFFY
ncbi:MAG: hypothetical protein ACFE85_07095 [Candidatus Hodarchaeota archaeon]